MKSRFGAVAAFAMSCAVAVAHAGCESYVVASWSPPLRPGRSRIGTLLTESRDGDSLRFVIVEAKAQ